MKRKKLTTEEKKLLFECLTKHKPDLLDKLDKLDLGELGSDIINEMRTATTDEFIQEGRKPDDEPNEYGFKLEDLNEQAR